MNDRDDMEKTLREFQHQPRAEVRQSVAAAYALSTGRSTRLRDRRVPVYVVTAAVLVAAVISFFLGQQVAAWRNPGAHESEHPAVELTWSAAPGDLL